MLKQMLPVVAAVVMGAMARRSGQGDAGGGLQGGLEQMGGSGGLIGMLTPLLDANRDGSMLDDVLGKFLS